VLKGSRCLLLKNPENLSEDRDEEAHMAAALELNEPLAKGYYLKEELRLIWTHSFRWPAQCSCDPGANERSRQGWHP